MYDISIKFNFEISLPELFVCQERKYYYTSLPTTRRLVKEEEKKKKMLKYSELSFKDEK